MGEIRTLRSILQTPVFKTGERPDCSTNGKPISLWRNDFKPFSDAVTRIRTEAAKLIASTALARQPLRPLEYHGNVLQYTISFVHSIINLSILIYYTKAVWMGFEPISHKLRLG